MGKLERRRRQKRLKQAFAGLKGVEGWGMQEGQVVVFVNAHCAAPTVPKMFEGHPVVVCVGGSIEA